MEFDSRRRIKTHFDIAPLIDIVFLLLIFFMLTANFIMRPAIKISLPMARTAMPQEEENIIVFISENNKVYLNDEEVALKNLKDFLEKKLEMNQEKTVILKADEKVNLGLAVKIMDIAKDANAQGIAISTRTYNEPAINELNSSLNAESY